MKINKTSIVSPGDFDVNNHFYPRVINAHIHPMVEHFTLMNHDRIINRYCHLHPKTDKEKLAELLKYQPKFFRWSGADLFTVTTEFGNRKMVVVETNSCPSGQKSMPSTGRDDDEAAYRYLLERTFVPSLKEHEKQLTEEEKKGALCVVFDKNDMEASGYACVLADVFDEPVYLTTYYNNQDPSKDLVKFNEEGQMFIRVNLESEWIPIRAAFRYVTQKPWNRIPLKTKTLILNPIISCVSGGRNKLIASKAYDLFNAELYGTGLEICVPETIHDVKKQEVPLWLQKFGGIGVVKVPYGNAGQGVYTIVNQAELDDFMKEESNYDQYIIQSLIGNYHWSSRSTKGQFYHVGTVPDKKLRSYVADLRMMISSTENGYKPLVIYGRRSRTPLRDHLSPDVSSWEMLGTNLSVKEGENTWSTETSRLLLMDRRDFNQLGIGLDDLINGFIQTVLASIAIDKMAQRLMEDGVFNYQLFKSLNDDDGLIAEIAQGTAKLGQEDTS